MTNTPDTSGPEKLLPGWLLLLGALTAIGPLSIDMYLPSFPTIAQQLGVGSNLVQLTLASFLVGLAVGQMFYGPVSDRFGRKPPLYVGMALYVLGSLACVFAHGKNISGEIALGNGGGAAVDAAVFDFAAIRLFSPALAWRHYVAVGVERQRRAGFGVLAAHDQVGDALHAIVFDGGGRYRMFLCLPAPCGHQLGDRIGVRRVVAGRGVGRDADDLLQETDFFIKVAVDPVAELFG